jgi:hypothetical protein
VTRATLPPRPRPSHDHRITIEDRDRNSDGAIPVIVVIERNCCRVLLWTTDEWDRACDLVNDPASGVTSVRAALLERWT